MHLCAWVGILLWQQSSHQDAAELGRARGTEPRAQSCSLHQAQSCFTKAQLPAQPTKAHINETATFGFFKMQISLFNARTSS